MEFGEQFVMMVGLQQTLLLSVKHLDSLRKLYFKIPLHSLLRSEEMKTINFKRVPISVKLIFIPYCKRYFMHQ